MMMLKIVKAMSLHTKKKRFQAFQSSWLGIAGIMGWRRKKNSFINKQNEIAA